MDEHRAISFSAAQQLARRHADEEKPHRFPKAFRSAAELILRRRDLVIGNWPDESLIALEKINQAHVTAPRFQDLDKAGREHINDVDQKRGLGCRGVLKVRVVRESVAEGKEPLVSSALVILIHERVQAGLIRFVINYECGHVSEFECLKQLHEIGKMAVILHHRNDARLFVLHTGLLPFREKIPNSAVVMLLQSWILKVLPAPFMAAGIVDSQVNPKTTDGLLKQGN